ncbi:Arabinan endo-1,5-alpha-L-arabinosidase [Mycena indigotica]|uniref:Arabinan endo-1,5-alpha-L-arabinosidase n=1 Tax=Mycena indigotica TaxID=2126181 RepID=A0A8H6W6G7_9AGAR|nr:Arabinan endo-1,5-alpha-L-arabinosidase [Mycena indigotica]KAF7307604.1 Arabinan endo-1,5-alpha-L-arabinosidase [Mycena indigotica]
MLVATVFLSLVSLSFAIPSSNFTSTKRSVSGPAIATDFPDPSLLWVPQENSWFAFGTTGNGKHVQMASSPDFKTWTYENTDPLPTVANWVASSANVWAPMVVQLDDGSFVMYYSATAASNTAAHCIGAATSTNVRGPYTPVQSTIACPISQGGAIDPAGHHHPDGSLYVVYKIDGNSLGHGGSCNNGVKPIVSTPIMLQKVAANGYTPIGSPVQILDRDDGDGPLVEAPSLVHVGSTFFLFFSSGCYSDTSYDLSYATASVVTGPYTKARAPNAPLLVTGTDGLRAPGSACVTRDGSKIAFHAFIGSDIGTGRAMWTGVPTFNGNIVTVK